MENNPSLDGELTLTRFTIFLALSTLDLIFSTAAGAAATAVGAHAEGDAITSSMLAIGAKTGAMKAGILFLAGLSTFAPLNFVLSLLVWLTLNSFGAAALLAAQVSVEVMGSASRALIIAAVVATFPAATEFVGGLAIAVCNPIISILAIPAFDALAGYVFARMAHNEGLTICAFSTGAKAGAMYGSVTLLYHAMTTAVRVYQWRSRGEDDLGHA